MSQLKYVTPGDGLPVGAIDPQLVRFIHMPGSSFEENLFEGVNIGGKTVGFVQEEKLVRISIAFCIASDEHTDEYSRKTGRDIVRGRFEACNYVTVPATVLLKDYIRPGYEVSLDIFKGEIIESLIVAFVERNLNILRQHVRQLNLCVAS